MKYERFGKTDLKVSMIGIGAWQAGMKNWGSDYSVEDVKKALKKAFELGINFIDTAEIYGHGKSEEIIGEVAKDYDVHIATKLAGFNTNRIEKSLKMSLERLKRRQIDLYQIHWPPSIYTNLEKVFRKLEELVDKGLIRYIGVSNFSSALLEKAQSSMKKYEIVSNQIHYNLLYRHAENSIIPYCEKNGIKIIAWSPIAKGALTGKYNKENMPKDGARRFDSAFKRFLDAKELLEYMANLASSKNASMHHIALAWLVKKKALPIPGVKREKHVEDLIKVTEIDLSEEEMKRLDELSEKFKKGEYSFSVPRLLPNWLVKVFVSIGF